LTWSSLVISLPLVLIQVLIFASPAGALRSLGFPLNFDLGGLASFLFSCCDRFSQNLLS
jgi:hypothetical protein